MNFRKRVARGLALLNTDGNTLYVRPFADDVINRNLSASPLFTQELEKKDRVAANEALLQRP